MEASSVVAAPVEPAGRSAREGLFASGRIGVLPLAALVLTPILVVLALRLPLINQLNYADAWFYTAYGFVPKHHFAVFGWNYFSVRFPPILAIGLFERLFGADDGFVLLRYVLAVACGASVYLCVRRFASVAVAVAAAVLLYLDPFFSRSLLWDYSSFIEVSAGLIGVSLWFWSENRRLALTALSGSALAIAVFANALVGTALFVLLAVEGVAALREGRSALLRYVARVSVLLGSSVFVFLVGYLSYLAILGSLSPYDLLRPTIEFFGESNAKSAPYQHAVSTWLLHEPRIWAPVVTSIALVVVLRGRLLGKDVVARVAQLCVAYTAFLWLYRFAVTSSVIETWWAYSVVVVVTAPALGVLLLELVRDTATASRRLIVVCAAFAITAVLVRNLPVPAGDLYRELGTHRLLVLVLIAVAVVAALLGALRSAARVGAFAVLAIALALMSYAPSVLDGRGTTGIFVTNASQEWTAYKGAQSFMDLVRNYDSPSHRVYLWFPGTLGYVSITWTDLPQYGDTLNVLGVSEGLAAESPLAAARIAPASVKYVMVLAPRASEVEAGRAALVRSGAGSSLVRSGTLADRNLSFALVALANR